MSHVLLLDGNSLLYRGFFAMRMLTTSDGLPTNAIYSLSLMLLTALERTRPDAVVCAFDAPVLTFRHEEFAGYKANRQRAPDELQPQRPLARDLMRAFNIPIVEVEGVEADDTIGSLAELAKRDGHEVLIVTGDLDAVQLVDDERGPVHILTTVKGVTETVIYDTDKVRERYGLAPVQIPDYKALKGDSSDNLPGVPGIGDKTATRLITLFGSVEAMLADSGAVGDTKLRQLLTEHSAEILQYKRLATIRRDVPLSDFNFVHDYQQSGVDKNAVQALFTRLEFRSLLKRALGGTPSKAAEPETSVPGFGAPPQFARDNVSLPLGKGVYLQFNTPLEKADFFSSTLISIGVAGDQAASDTPVSLIPDSIKQFLEDPDQPKVVHDSKLAFGALALLGITLRGVVFDTLLAAYLLNAGKGSYKLDDLIAANADMPMADAPSAIAAQIQRVQSVLLTSLDKISMRALHDTMELPLVQILAGMELSGVAIDAAWLMTVSGTMAEQIKVLEESIYSLAGGTKFAIGSTRQVQAVLFEQMGLPSGKKTKTGYSTDSEVMEGLASQGYEIGGQILQWRELTKMKTTYADSLPLLMSPRDGRVHTSLNQTITATGRLSSSNPNLQNIPIRTEIGREIRKAFVADPGKLLVAADYSQIELRILAHMTSDPELTRTFASDGDIHRRTAALIFGTDEALVTSEQRRRAKTINFAVIYGMSDFRLSVELDTTVAIASSWKKRYFAEYPGVKQFADQVLSTARAAGYVETLLGRRRYTPDINSRVFQFRQSAEREAINMPIQGTSADIMKLAMIHVDQALSSGTIDARMVLQVHDELLFECKPDHVQALARTVRSCMEQAYPLHVPLRVEVRQGWNWNAMEPI